MKRFECKELTVSFNASHQQAVRLSPNDGASAQWLSVEVSEGSLIVRHVREDNSVERVVIFNYAHVKEFTANYCKGAE